MKIPLFSGAELWRQLCSEQIGFYTKRTAGRIPNQSGLYAWFFPFRVSDDLGRDIDEIREIFSYDASSKFHIAKEQTQIIQWQAIRWKAQLVKDHHRSASMESHWESAYLDKHDQDRLAMRQILMLSTVFSRPLYVGLTLTSLSARYEQHVSGSKKNSFYKRFTEYVEESGIKISVADLLFVAIPLRQSFSNNLNHEERKSFIKAAEYFLKNTTYPIFGER